jgi:hypothetical protein
MKGKMLMMVAVLSGCVAIAPTVTDGASAGPPDNLAEVARSLPPLQRAEQSVDLPLQHVEPYAWRPIRSGINLAAACDDGAAVKRLEAIVARGGLNGGFPALEATLTVSYERTRGMAAGAAFVVPPGTLAGLEQLTLRIKGEPDQNLRVTLTDMNGHVYTFPGFRVREAYRDITLDAEKLSYDPYQNSGPRPKSFDLSRVIMITVLDISGYMSLSTPDCTWTIASMTATVGEQSSAITHVPTKHDEDEHVSHAERVFFNAFNYHFENRYEALETLTDAWRADPQDARLTLLLGLNHLWIASEGDERDPRLVEHLQLACRQLKRAAALDPENVLIPGWLIPAEMALAEIEGCAQTLQAQAARLEEVTETDPCFYSVPMGIVHFDDPVESASFEAGLAAMRAGLECAADHPGRTNGPRWPHSAHGFLLALADLEWRAGETERAREVLEMARSTPGVERWPFRHLVQERLERLNAQAGAAGEPPFILAPGNAASCRVCHASGAAGG